MTNTLDDLEDNIIGFYGLVTSTQDWCEDNYVVTYYIAEFWNTISNFFILFLGIFGLIQSIRCQSEKRYQLCYIGLSIVGLGSAVFHCTLKWEAQLLDEIPMLIGSIPQIYSILGADTYSIRKHNIMKFFFTAFPISVIPYYMYTKDFLIFLIAFSSGIVAMVVKMCFLIKHVESIIPKSERIYPNNGRSLFYRALFYYGIAFILWIIDLGGCSQLKVLKLMVNPYFRPFLELHAYWHFGSGYGTYYLALASQVIYTQIKTHSPKFNKKINPDMSKHIKMVCYYKKCLPYPKIVLPKQA